MRAQSCILLYCYSYWFGYTSLPQVIFLVTPPPQSCSLYLKDFLNTRQKRKKRTHLSVWIWLYVVYGLLCFLLLWWHYIALDVGQVPPGTLSRLSVKSRLKSLALWLHSLTVSILTDKVLCRLTSESKQTVTFGCVCVRETFWQSFL